MSFLEGKQFEAFLQEDVIALIDDVAERARGWVVRLPSLLCGWWSGMNSPYINHFLSPDSIIPDQTNPQSWDRYAYVNNNPLRYSDPSGHRTTGACGLGGEECAIYTPAEIVKKKDNLQCGSKLACDRKIGHLARQLEDYLQTNAGYDPVSDRSEYGIMADDGRFKTLRGIYWKERLEGNSSTKDNPLLLYQYYDLRESISYANFEWDSNDIDWSAVAIDAAATVGSFIGLNSAIKASKFGPFLKGYNFAFGTWSVQHTASKNGLLSAETVLSGGGFIPGPAGTIFSASSLITDLLGGLHQRPIPYIPSIPRNPW